MGVKRLSTCSQCGQVNTEGARFCVKCGASLAATAQPVQPEQPAAVSPPPPQPAQPAAPPPAPAAAQPPAQPPPPATQASPPAAYPPPVQGYAAPPQPAQPAYQQPPYAPTPQAYAPAAYPAAPAAYARLAGTRGTGFWVGASMVLVAGVMVLVSSFMAWISGPLGMGSMSGWDIMDTMGNKLFEYGNGYPFFSGLCSLIAGGIIALAGLLMLLTRTKGLAALAIVFSIAALGIAVTNLVYVFRPPFEGLDLSIGVGMYLFLIFSLLGIIGGGIAAAD